MYQNIAKLLTHSSIYIIFKKFLYAILMNLTHVKSYMFLLSLQFYKKYSLRISLYKSIYDIVRTLLIYFYIYANN